LPQSGHNWLAQSIGDVKRFILANIVGCVMSAAKPRELTRRLATIDANISNDEHPEDIGTQSSALILQISLASMQAIDSLIADLKDLRTRIENRRSRIQDDIIEFAELSRSAVQVTKIVSDSVAQVQTGPGSNDPSSSGSPMDLEVVSVAPTQ
jgi:hypothetical protein